MNKIDHGAQMAGAVGLKRSEHWEGLERAVKKLYGETCEICGNGPIQVHHILPFHDTILAGRPELELTIENLVRLCETEKDKPTEDHHLLVGHLDDFKSYNAKVRDCIVTWKNLPGAQIRELADWKAMAAAKPLSYPQMAPDVQTAFRATLDGLYVPDKITVWNGKQFTRGGVVVVPTAA